MSLKFPSWLTMLLSPLFYRRWVELERRARVTGIARETQVFRVGPFELVIDRKVTLLP